VKKTVRVELIPLGQVIEVERGTPLQDCLFPYGVEFPCGGRGRCRGCRVKVLSGSLPITPEEQRLLEPSELAEGWRLACRGRAEEDLKLEIAQWETTVLADSTVFEFTPGEGLGITVDIGTTTLVAQLLDLETGHVLGVLTGLNPQARHGSDLMTRIHYAVNSQGRQKLQELIRNEVGDQIRSLIENARVEGRRLREVVLVGNTVMHHLFSGIDVEPLSRFPFESPYGELQEFSAAEIGWNIPCPVRFLPCLGSFVGSDILAGVLATGLLESRDLMGLVDLGTNGEIVVGNRDGLVCASTAAGPAFEGARISMGMRAATGAIAKVSATGGEIRCHVLGNVAPRGLCGSGLVDAVATGLDLGRILENGRFADRAGFWEFFPPVALNQTDVRELQLAKGAIAAGFRILLKHCGADKDDIARLYLAGAFGNYISRRSARRIGLLDLPRKKVRPAGNTALLGAKIALFNHRRGSEAIASILEKTRHVCLSSDEEFEETYIDEMSFPGS
jgi:uncharacterized 2Fe-2S/4Fe-4S cluster protein (DUF4445 family)